MQLNKIRVLVAAVAADVCLLAQGVGTTTVTTVGIVAGVVALIVP